MQAAQKYLAKGQLDKAITEYEIVVKSDPKDARTLLKLGDLYTRKGANKEAGATYRKVAEQYAEQGFFLKAVAVCKQILKLDPSQLDVWEKLAEMYELLSLVSDALATYEQVVEAHTRAGNGRKALRGLEKVAELDPENVAARIRYAEALSKLNKNDEAAEAFTKGAELLKKQGRIDDYLKVGERLLFHQADNFDLARELAAAYLDRRDAKLALAKLQPCFNADPKNVDTLRLLARAFEQLGQIQKTVSVLKEVARVYALEARRAEQGSVLKKIVSLDPGDAEARRELSQLGHLPNREETVPMELSEEEADSILVDDEEEEQPQRASGSGLRTLDAVDDEQKRAQIARLMGECDVFLRYGLYDKMVTHLHQVLDLAPNHIEARSKLKDVYLKTKKPSDAVMQLIMLGEIVSQTDVLAAREHLREALRLDPVNQAVAERLTALEALDAASDEDELIIVDEQDDDEESDFSDVTASDSLPAGRSEESFASVMPGDGKHEEDDDEPEMSVEEADEGSFDDSDEIVMDAEDHDDDDVIDVKTGEHQVAYDPHEVDDNADTREMAAPTSMALPDLEPVEDAPQDTSQDELPEELVEALGEIDFYLKQGLNEEARETLDDALESFPEHPALLAKRASIDGADGDEPSGEDDNAFALAEKLAAQVPPPSAAANAGPPIEINDVIAQFKKGVAKQIDKDDSATHYDLGIAYMEMGLQAEAIDEFKLCLNDEARKCRSHTMIGLAYVAKGDMEPGIEHFKLALGEKPNADEELGLWFEIGNSHELLGKNMEALVWYEKVEEKNATFRDVALRIERLGVSRTAEQESDDFDDLFDNMILKE